MAIALFDVRNTSLLQVVLIIRVNYVCILTAVKICILLTVQTFRIEHFLVYLATSRSAVLKCWGQWAYSVLICVCDGVQGIQTWATCSRCSWTHGHCTHYPVVRHRTHTSHWTLMSHMASTCVHSNAPSGTSTYHNSWQVITSSLVIIISSYTNR